MDHKPDNKTDERIVAILIEPNQTTYLKEKTEKTIDERIVETLVELNNKLDAMTLFLLTADAKRKASKGGK